MTTPEDQRKYIRKVVMAIRDGSEGDRADKTVKQDDLLRACQMNIEVLQEERNDYQLVDDNLLASKYRVWMNEVIIAVLSNKEVPEFTPEMLGAFYDSIETSVKVLLQTVEELRGHELSSVDGLLFQQSLYTCNIFDRNLGEKYASVLCFAEMLHDFLLE